MRQLLLSVVLVAAALHCAGAQDIILLRNGDELKAVVKEIGTEEVRYAVWPEGIGPLLTLSADDIFRITLQNGETQMFGSSASDGIYEIGDIYDRNGLKGIVVHTTDGGRHGLIMSLILPHSPHHVYEKYKRFKKDDEKMWCSRAIGAQTVGLTDEEDGMNNLRILAQAIEANGLSWDDFPAFKLCVEMGDGWYLPAFQEVECIVMAMNEGSLLRDMFALQRFNSLLVETGGTPIIPSGYMYPYPMNIVSSTEYDKVAVKSISYGDGSSGTVTSDAWLFAKTWTGKNYNGWSLCIIPVHKF